MLRRAAPRRADGVLTACCAVLTLCGVTCTCQGCVPRGEYGLVPRRGVERDGDIASVELGRIRGLREATAHWRMGIGTARRGVGSGRLPGAVASDSTGLHRMTSQRVAAKQLRPPGIPIGTHHAPCTTRHTPRTGARGGYHGKHDERDVGSTPAGLAPCAPCSRLPSVAHHVVLCLETWVCARVLRRGAQQHWN